MKNMYSQSALRVREGRDSILVMLTPFCASGVSNRCTAPGRFSADITSEVRSLPEGGAATIIGEVVGEELGRVVLRTRIGTHRLLEKLSGEQLPRIC